MRTSIIAILVSISAMCAAQVDSTSLDSVAITAPTHLKALPELLQEAEQLNKAKVELETAARNNSEKIMLILSSYADPTKIRGLSTDRKKIIIEKK